MLYDRKIKYVDYYENGERVKGGGFVKLEIRDGILKMDLNIRGLHPTDSFVRDVVVSGSEKETVLGQIALQEGVGSFSYSCQTAEGIGSAGISYEELQEIKIPVGGSREIRCIWGRTANKVVDHTDQLEAVGEKPQMQALEVREASARGAKSPGTVPIIMEDSETAALAAIVQEMKIQEAAPRKAEVQEAEVQEAELQGAELSQTEPLLSTPVKRAPEPRPREPKAVSVDKSQSEQKPAVKLLEEKWQQLSAIYPHIRPFKDDRDYLSLSPSDFVMFPESYYRAANNSFLLHGFYNYKHLILARVEHRGEARYYLGVPGNYYEREKQVAVMFGFESFECDREPAKTGDFGYYMMRMEL